MLKFIFKRILWMIPVMLGVLFLVFTINYFTPGDPVVSLLGSNYTQEQYDAKEKELGLDQPFFTQFFNYVTGLLFEGDLGTSYSTKRPVQEELVQRFPVTIKLGVMGVCLTLIIGIPLGVISATHHQKALDYTLSTGAILFAAVPGFWLALMSMVVFCFHLQWLPASGLDSWKHYILPVACLGLSPVSSVLRMTRSSMLEVIRQDYIRTARAKGLKERVVISRHALKNALIPVITVVGLQMSLIMGGSILIESIFSIPGIGAWMNTAIQAKNHPVVMSGVLMISLSVCVMNLLVDLAYAAVDPRIRSQFSGGGKKKKKKNAEVKTEGGAVNAEA